METVISNPYKYDGGNVEMTPQKDWKFKEVKSDFGFHIEEYLEYKIEAFLFSLILVSLVYFMVNYKKLIKD
tara:strand:- start:905 stop:1117 length:213 start_codon:yes stop_codon:yes gene_type:complete